MNKFFAAAIVALTLTACSSGATTSNHKATIKNPLVKTSATPVSSKCADTLAHEIATNSGKGAYDCLGDEMKFNLWFKDGVTNDAQLIDLLSGTDTYDVATRPASVPAVPDADPNKFAYHLYPTKDAGTPGYIQNGKALLIVEDNDGKVISVQFV